MQVHSTLKEQIDAYLDQLSEHDQERVLAYARRLAAGPQGIPTQELLDFFRQYPLTDEEKEEMQHIMDEIKDMERR